MTSPFTRNALIEWLKAQPADASYKWGDCNSCMLALWVKTVDPEGESDPNGHSYMYIVGGEVVDLSEFKDIALNGKATYGDALLRALKA